MKFFGFVIFFLTSTVFAQQVVPLFRNNSLTTFVTMPFRLESASQQAIPILSIDITSSKANCQGMIDPMISSNFLVKCTHPDSLRVSVFYKDASGNMMRINYGPLVISKISETDSVLAPVTENVDKYKAGRDLFSTQCMSCHQSPHDKPNRSSTQIKSAIANITRMKSIKLTDAQVKSISDYLNNLD